MLDLICDVSVCAWAALLRWVR